MIEDALDRELCDYRCIHEQRIEKARRARLSERENTELAQLFKAMGDPNRLRILWALAEEEMCVCDIAAFLRVSESAVSHQLRILRQLHLVSNRRQGPVLYYRLNDDHVNQLVRIGLEHIRE